MKKLLALMLAAALALSLAACGGGEDDAKTPGTGNGDAAGSDAPGNTPSGSEEAGAQNEPGITKEELLDVAADLNPYAIDYEFQVNSSNPQDKFIGKVFKFDGTVQEIKDGYAIIIPNDSPSVSETDTRPKIDVFAYLSSDELSTLSSGGSVSIVGEISDVSLLDSTDGTLISIIMEDYCYIQ